jgi:hypothetical protein
MAEKKETKAKKVFDVAKPGKSAATATSRPVIVGHGAMLRDPMMQDQDKPTSQEKSDIQIRTTPKRVAPPTEPATPESEAEPAVIPAEETPPQEATPAVPESPPESDDAATEEALPDDPVTTKKKADQQAQTEADNHQKEIDALVAKKTYFLPIGQATRRRNRRRFLVGFMVVLLVMGVGGYVAVDAGLVNVNVTLPVDLIKN